jgi:hypothetical protein
LSKALSQRLADCKANNPEFSTNLSLRMHGFGKCARIPLLVVVVVFHVTEAFSDSCAAMQIVFGGAVDDLRPFLLEERLPEGWLPKNAARFGLTLGAFNSASLKIALGTKTVPPRRQVDSEESAET